MKGGCCFLYSLRYGTSVSRSHVIPPMMNKENIVHNQAFSMWSHTTRRIHVFSFDVNKRGYTG